MSLKKFACLFAAAGKYLEVILFLCEYFPWLFFEHEAKVNNKKSSVVN
jgi:hypothetical protein